MIKCHFYGAYHTNRVNVLIYMLCAIPLIVWFVYYYRSQHFLSFIPLTPEPSF